MDMYWTLGRLLLRLGVWCAVIYLCVLVLLFLLQGRLLYPAGGSAHVATPDAIGLPWQSVTLVTEDQLALDAWWLPHAQPRATLLFLHGNAGNISHRLYSLQQFSRLGLSILIIDYRGYGRSEGRPSEAGTALDARAAWDWLQLHAEGEIVVFGRSLGAAVAAELAREVRPAALIMESSFRSVPDLAATLYPWFPVRRLSRFDYPVIDYVRDIDVPVLIIHSKDDEIIPFSEGEAVYAAAAQPKQLLPIRGGHNDGFVRSAREYESGIESFLDQHVARPGAASDASGAQ